MTIYYVRQGDGDDGSTGLSPSRAFETLTRGIKALATGDTLIVGPGVYDPQTIETPGVRLCGDGAIIDGKGTWHWGVLIRAPHVTVEDFEVRNVNDGAGIHIRHTHHVAVRGCLVHDIIGSGIFATRSDYVTIDRNELFRVWSPKVDSTISIFQPLPHPGRDLYFRLRVTNNLVHHAGRPRGTDGFAFILDNNPKVWYPHRLLVEGNTFHNNAKGMMFFNCRRFVCRHNHGQRNGPLEFRFRNSHGLVHDNSALATGDGLTYDVKGPCRITFRNNAAWNETTETSGLSPTVLPTPEELWEHSRGTVRVA